LAKAPINGRCRHAGEAASADALLVERSQIERRFRAEHGGVPVAEL
jgi:hypothetical protein